MIMEVLHSKLSVLYKQVLLLELSINRGSTVNITGQEYFIFHTLSLKHETDTSSFVIHNECLSFNLHLVRK